MCYPCPDAIHWGGATKHRVIKGIKEAMGWFLGPPVGAFLAHQGNRIALNSSGLCRDDHSLRAFICAVLAIPFCFSESCNRAGAMVCLRRPACPIGLESTELELLVFFFER